MNLMNFKRIAAICLTILCAQPAGADGTEAIRWEADTVDPQRFSGNVTITGAGDQMTLGYSFVFDAQIISMSDVPARMEPLGNACWSVQVNGEFMLDIADAMEVVFCRRNNQAFWSLLDTRAAAVRLPVWASFKVESID